MKQHAFETRTYTVLEEARRPNGRSSLTIRCPFCDGVTEAFRWSLAGSGKRCRCGAKFGHGGQAYKDCSLEAA